MKTKPMQPTLTEFELIPEIRNRWSPRAIAPDPVPRARLRAVLEAARWAPSSFNEQPWRFLVGDSEAPEFRERLRELLNDGNSWALRPPVLILSAWRRTFTKTGAENRVAFRDLGAAEENLLLQAVSEGLVGHQMAGFSVSGAEALLRDEGLDSDYEVGTMTVLGYPGDPDTLDETLREREEAPRRRRPLDEIALFGGANQGG